MEERGGTDVNQNYEPFPNKYKDEIRRLREDMNSIHERLDRKTEADYNEFTRLE